MANNMYEEACEECGWEGMEDELIEIFSASESSHCEELHCPNCDSIID